MNDLPSQSPQSVDPTPQPVVAPPQPQHTAVSSITGGKERDMGIGLNMSEVPHVTEVGQDIDLPQEVTAAGVSIRPTQVMLPNPVAQMGVKPVGVNVSIGTGASVKLPLSDEQINRGLRESTNSSFRWLAEWCNRRLKQVHFAIKKVHGQITRVQTS